MTDSIPQFGEQVEDAAYVLRPGGYAIIARATGEIAVLAPPRGWFLPGGGQENDESAEDAAIRETREECGLPIRLVQPVGTADELLYAAEEGTYFRKRCTFFRAEMDGGVSAGGGGGEMDVTLIWVTADEAAKRLRHASQRWAVTEACRLPRDAR